MKFVKPSIKVITATKEPLALLERGAKTCTRREVNGDFGIISRVMKKGHFSVIEHASASVEITCDRGVSHELVRHRLASFSQESQRYVREKGDIDFIIPHWSGIEEGSGDLENLDGNDRDFALHCCFTEIVYNGFSHLPAEDRRGVLSNMVATRLLISANFREWIHIFALRCGEGAGKEVKRVISLVKREFEERWPLIFKEDL